MEPKVNATVVGLIVLLLSAALLTSAIWLSVGFNKKNYNNYLVYLDESAAGLSEESPVLFQWG